jgi:DNA-directed RNA polymerase subunit H (RpoH/RPB5)
MDITERIRRSLNTVRIMFEARNYKNVRGPTKTTLNKSHIIELFAEYTNPRNGEIEKVTCVWIPFNSLKLISTIGKQDIQEYCYRDQSCHYIFITDSISFQAVEILTQILPYWEVLSYNDTACAKNNHCYVPQYQLLNESEIQAVEKQFGPRTGFHKMVAKVDAMARFMDFRKGDVVRVSKFSCIGGSVKGYRYLIAEDEIM